MSDSDQLRLPEWYDRTKVVGPYWPKPDTPRGDAPSLTPTDRASGQYPMVAFDCHDHLACMARGAAGGRVNCHVEVAMGLHTIAAVSEGFCPYHENCRLEPVSLSAYDPQSRRVGVEAAGRCMRDDMKVWRIGTDPDTGPWWEWDRSEWVRVRQEASRLW